MGFGGTVRDAAIALAHFIHAHPSLVAGKSVVELGCGCSAVCATVAAPPDCSAFFMTLDHEEGVCKWHMSFRIFLALLLGALGVSELLLQTLHVQLPSLYARVAAASAAASAVNS